MLAGALGGMIATGGTIAIITVPDLALIAGNDGAGGGVGEGETGAGGFAGVAGIGAVTGFGGPDFPSGFVTIAARI